MTFSYFCTVRLSHTDAAGVVYFAQGLSLCHQAYEAWLENKGVDIQAILKQQETAFPIAHAEIDFIQPMFCADKLEIKLDLIETNQSDFTINYQIYRVSEPEKIIVRALTKHVCIDIKSRTRMPLPLNIRS